MCQKTNQNLKKKTLRGLIIDIIKSLTVNIVEKKRSNECNILNRHLLLNTVVLQGQWGYTEYLFL